jgi:hypothetical protein
MNKPWLGYLSSAMLLLGGVLMIAGGKTAVGIVFIVLAVAGLIIKIVLNKKQKP